MNRRQQVHALAMQARNLGSMTPQVLAELLVCAFDEGAQDERRACITVCDDIASEFTRQNKGELSDVADLCAVRIMARSTT